MNDYRPVFNALSANRSELKQNNIWLQLQLNLNHAFVTFPAKTAVCVGQQYQM